MADWAIVATVGLVAGLVASAAMSAFQAAAAPALGLGGSNSDPSNVQAADSASEAVAGRPVTQKHREKAGTLVHYATGAALGLVYALLVAQWPVAGIGFGVAYGLVIALVLDDFLVPLFGWGPWPFGAPFTTNLYSLASHAVFGAVLEGGRRLGLALLA